MIFTTARKIIFSIFLAHKNIVYSYLFSIQENLSQKKKEKIVLWHAFNGVGRRYFLHQKFNEKAILIHTLAILENLVLCENDSKNHITSCAWCSIKKYFILSPILSFFYILVAFSLDKMIRKFGYIFDRS